MILPKNILQNLKKCRMKHFDVYAFFAISHCMCSTVQVHVYLFFKSPTGTRITKWKSSTKHCQGFITSDVSNVKYRAKFRSLQKYLCHLELFRILSCRSWRFGVFHWDFHWDSPTQSSGEDKNNAWFREFSFCCFYSDLQLQVIWIAVAIWFLHLVRINASFCHP